MSGVPNAWRTPFPESEIPFILAGTLRCMAMVTKTHSTEHENHITTRLWKKLLCDPELKTRPIQVSSEFWEINGNNEDGIIGHHDIHFIYSTLAIHPWPHFAIEAKRLHVTFPSGWNSLIPEYVTSESSKSIEEEQGMMCFISGRYSKWLCSAAMLGYVFDGDVAKARTGIEHAIQRHAPKLKLASSGWIKQSSNSPTGSVISESLHEISSEGKQEIQFRIYHLLVPV